MKNPLKCDIELLVKEANFSLRRDVSKLLNRAYRAETNKKAKKALSWILGNADIAKKQDLAICQDTGLPIIFIEVGNNKSISCVCVKNIEQEVSLAYRKNYLRPFSVSPLCRITPSYKGVITHVDFNPAKRGIKVTVFPKGFGSENKSQLKMFNPTVEVTEIEDFIVESVAKAGPEACPPFIVGVGIGGTSDEALLLAKKALLAGIDLPNKDRLLNNLEKRLLKKINALGIGPMGLGGTHTALAVKIKTVPTHIAGLPVAINISCHALRSASCELKNITANER
ncbi:MAG: fumarate hydratase [Candidatus Omnitrophica bacterium]|jgi:fumarate hydratase subunit alpha|nr:fumarate hydratase [Candidatus Omnitrophota bacterium]